MRWLEENKLKLTRLVLYTYYECTLHHIRRTYKSILPRTSFGVAKELGGV